MLRESRPPVRAAWCPRQAGPLSLRKPLPGRRVLQPKLTPRAGPRSSWPVARARGQSASEPSMRARTIFVSSVAEKGFCRKPRPLPGRCSSSRTLAV